MNPNTGELRRFARDESMPDAFERVPDRLQAAASMKLRIERAEATQVNLLSSHPLARWAKDRRKAKRKAKIAAASRRRNRHGK
jgi:RecA-family ATPase